MLIGLYVNPPQHAVVFSIDEKTAIQALDRREPVLPLSPGRAERHGFEYYRHGTLSLYAALNTRSGEVIGKTASRHTSAEFVAFRFLTLWRANLEREKSILSPTTSQLTRRKKSAISWQVTRVFISTTHRLIHPGSIRSNYGSPRSSETSSLGASSLPSQTFGANSCATSATTTKCLAQSNGHTPTLRDELLVPNQMLQSTRSPAGVVSLSRAKLIAGLVVAPFLLACVTRGFYWRLVPRHRRATVRRSGGQGKTRTSDGR